MSPQDISMLSAIGTLVLGTVIVPWVVAYVVKQSWTNTVKRLVAIGVSFAAATAGWYLDTVLTGQDRWQGIAITGPIIFGLATASYIKYWKQYTGDAEEFDLFGSIFKRGK